MTYFINSKPSSRPFSVEDITNNICWQIIKNIRKGVDLFDTKCFDWIKTIDDRKIFVDTVNSYYINLYKNDESLCYYTNDYFFEERTECAFDYYKQLNNLFKTRVDIMEELRTKYVLKVVKDDIYAEKCKISPKFACIMDIVSSYMQH